MRHGEQGRANEKAKEAKGNQPAKDTKNNERERHFAAAFDQQGPHEGDLQVKIAGFEQQSVSSRCVHTRVHNHTEEAEFCSS